jgi:hypothetical protein
MNYKHEESISVDRWMRRGLKEVVGVHCYFSECGELGTCVVARELDKTKQRNI